MPRMTSAPTPPARPRLVHIANLWTLMAHPAAETEWTLEEKLDAIAEAGFDGVTWGPIAGLKEGLAMRGLEFLGGLSSASAGEFGPLLADLKAGGAEQVNVQLGDDFTPTPEALGLALRLFDEAKALGLQAAIEMHRDTCTETPEKTFALADAYAKVTGELMPISWDFSHFAVVKHLRPEHFAERMLTRPDLVQRAQQFHFRPFNGHHCQIPVTDGRGRLTREFREWLPFAEAVLRCWLEAEENHHRAIYLCPEMGSLESGYNLSTLPNSWEEAKILRAVLAERWDQIVA